MDEPMDEPVVALDHPRFRTAWTAIFTRKFVADCMTHRCALTAEPHTERLDVCCQYGADIDINERAAIEARSDKIRALMRDDAKNVPWFEEDVVEDADYPSGQVVRSEVHKGACIFLAHDRRGCAIHRAALEEGWALRDIKPVVCRLFPLSWIKDEIVIAEEVPEYTCAHVDGPTVYRLARDTIAEVFGEPLVVALDAAEARVLAAEARMPAAEAPAPADAPRRLPVMR